MIVETKRIESNPEHIQQRLNISANDHSISKATWPVIMHELRENKLPTALDIIDRVSSVPVSENAKLFLLSRIYMYIIENHGGHEI